MKLATSRQQTAGLEVTDLQVSCPSAIQYLDASRLLMFSTSATDDTNIEVVSRSTNLLKIL